MKDHQNELLGQLKTYWPYGAFILLTLGFFLIKGISYAFIGSYVPLLVIIAILLMIGIGFSKSKKAFFIVIGFWSILIILWALVRLLLSMVNLFVKPIPESHVNEQLGIVGIILSATFLFAGFYLWRFRRVLRDGH